MGRSTWCVSTCGSAHGSGRSCARRSSAIRKLQPNVMLRARGIGNYGDYYTPEGFVPGNPENTNMPWFVIYPLGRSFSYESDPAQHKGGRWIVRNLIDAVAKGGGFMVGIGPDAKGRFHPTAIENLRGSGRLAQDQRRSDLCHAPTRWRSVARGRPRPLHAKQRRPLHVRDHRRVAGRRPDTENGPRPRGLDDRAARHDHTARVDAGRSWALDSAARLSADPARRASTIAWAFRIQPAP